VTSHTRNFDHRLSMSAGSIDFGDLRRLQPVSREYGFDRGTPIDRYYNRTFFTRHAGDIRGRVLEIGDDHVTRDIGGDRVDCSDVLNLHAGAPGTTIVTDLATDTSIPAASFDCVIVEQTLQLIFDVGAALHTLERILRPGGVLLLTVPGTISQLCPGKWRHSWCWGFTRHAVRRLLSSAFAPERCTIYSCGNVLASIAFLEGISAEELTAAELDHEDALYPLLLAARAVK
jgi:SAM-dependent methyltransferase